MNPKALDILLDRFAADLAKDAQKKLNDDSEQHERMTGELEALKKKIKNERATFEKMKEEFHLIESEELAKAKKEIAAVSTTIEQVRDGSASMMKFYKEGRTPQQIEAQAREKITMRMGEIGDWLRSKAQEIAQLEEKAAALDKDIAALELAAVKQKLGALKAISEGVADSDVVRETFDRERRARAEWMTARDTARLHTGSLAKSFTLRVNSMRELEELQFSPAFATAEARQRLAEITTWVKKQTPFRSVCLKLAMFGKDVRRWYFAPSEKEFEPALPPELKK